MAELMADSLARYDYALLQAVPRADRAEVVNIGVVLYCRDQHFLAAESCADLGRVAGLDPAVDLPALRRQLDLLTASCRRAADLPWDAKVGEQGKAFAWLAAPRSTVLRAGPVHGGFAADAGRELRRLVRALC
ncbi:MAG: DUF3037 domain-containing protein [Candidatus Nanopelagicales bacterium]